MEVRAKKFKNGKTVSKDDTAGEMIKTEGELVIS